MSQCIQYLFIVRFLCFVLFLGSWGGIVSPGAASQIPNLSGINVGKLTGFGLREVAGEKHISL